MSSHSPVWIGTCACGKRMYLSRRDARHAAKAGHRGDHGLSEYRCAESDTWHIGHVDRLVKRGVIAR